MCSKSTNRVVLQFASSIHPRVWSSYPKIVDTCWMPPSREDIAVAVSEALQPGSYAFCFCPNVVGGCASPRLVQELTWKRVANMRGDPGKNIGLVLLNEFVNNDFKDVEMVKKAVRCQQVKRCSQIGGGFGGLFSETLEYSTVCLVLKGFILVSMFVMYFSNFC
ncbi:hypothetical protein CAPTEDRAFT_198194 [Capitella teleta]|uniref:Uncharacterized protein n=1 Tax=Capitella teleta TaxID=283909 RepID=X1ZYD1_CAPTE|nr:hypothetical protein CAPTEDRAFT_198194 [Capitella teleta]|eukprot:ELU04733.1 hypothetical protein CAPTEDRAFT_198194 [Capitella teleta]